MENLSGRLRDVGSTEQAPPPRAHRVDTVHTLHGVDRPDPYAWMRDPQAPDLVEYLRAERSYHDSATAHLAPLRNGLADAVVARIPRSERSVGTDRSRCVYYTERTEGREYGEIRRFSRHSATESQSDHRDGDELLLNIDGLRSGSTYAELGVCEVSPDEDLLAYSVDLTGEEVYELRFRDLRSGRDLSDVIPRSYYGCAWSADSRAFFYTVPDDAYRAFQVRVHVLGTDPADDPLVLQEDDHQYEFDVRASRSGRLVIIQTSNRDTTEEWLVDAADPLTPPRCVERRRRGVEYVVEHAPTTEEDRLVIVTNDRAPEYRLMATPLVTPGRDNWVELVPENPAERIESVAAIGSHLVVSLRSGGLPRLRVLRADGSTSYTLDPPTAGLIRLGDNLLPDATHVVVEEQSYTQPPRWYDVDLATGERRLRHTQSAPGYDPDAYLSERVSVTARDGAEIPVTLVRRRDTPLDGSRPCLMYGYGAYEYSFESEFDPALTVLLDRGVVFAHAHVRGGGEGGRRWWLDGRMEHKQHTFDDHVDVARALGQRWVDPALIASRGLSAGGLLQGAVFSQAPEVFRAVVAEVPFVDVVTTMLDESIPLTATEWDEWGDPRREPDFRWMLAYSPYDNLPPAGSRPDLLVTGAVHDPRVMVREPAKWVAALRASDPDWSPRCLFRVEVEEGAHAGPNGRLAHARYEAEIYAWVLDRLMS
jgi:oligopeptidase B